jgi:hypothetical protein
MVDNRFLIWYMTAKDRVKTVGNRENLQKYLILT